MGKIKGIRFKGRLNGWMLLSTLFVLLFLLPNLNVMVNLMARPNENWIHIKTYLLKDYVINTFTLVLFSGGLSIIIGTSLAWLTTMYEFPLSKVLKTALILPLSIPPYIGAYTYVGLLNYTGVIQSYLRNTWQINLEQKYFDIMTMPGAIFVFSLFLFPYVYMITQSFLEKQSADLIENGRVLGRGQLAIFFRVILPVARGAIIGGSSLVVLEVLNDYGVVKYFGIPTFSTAIFKTWFAMGDIESAVRLAGLLMIVVIGVLFGEKLMRSRKRYSYTTAKIKPIKKIDLKGISGILATSYGLIIFALGFAIPTLQLCHWALLTYKKVLNREFIDLMINSVGVGAVTSMLIVVIAIIIGNYNRIHNTIVSKIYSKITVLGYSIPGSVIALGVIIFFLQIDNYTRSFGIVLSGTITMLIMAYVIRFVTIGYNSIESSYDKIGKRFFEASRTLGKNTVSTFIKVDLPMMLPGIMTAAILVFIDVIKELPLTLILRPFNFDTLATKTYEFANDEMIHEAAMGSLFIIMLSSLSIILFKIMANRRKKQ